MAGRRAGSCRSWPQRLLITLNIGLVFASLAAAAGLGYLNFKLDQVPRVDLGDDLTAEPEDPGEPQNYLLVGTDSAARLDEGDPVTNGRENLGTLSDTIMLLRVDPTSTQAQLLSFPRDLWVTIPGAGEQRINAALAAGGPETLINTITENFGVPVHHYVEVDFLGFQELVRAIDGVPLYFDKPVRDPKTGLSIPTAGCISLTPDQALAYARSRSLEFSEDGGATYQVDGSGDLGRISRQQEFIRRAIQRSIAKGVRNPITLNSLINVGINSVIVDTELSADDFVQLGTRFRSFDPAQLQTMTLDLYDDSVNGQSILRLQDTEANQQRIDIFKGVGGAGSVQSATVRIAVNNGTGISGQATEAAEGFANLGFDTSPGTGDAERFDFSRSVVRYAPGREAIAQYVAAQIEDGADLEEVGATYIADVIVVTGADFAGVRAELQPPPTPLPGGGDTAGGDTGGAEPPSTDPSVTTTTQSQYGEVPTTPADQTCG